MFYNRIIFFSVDHLKFSFILFLYSTRNSWINWNLCFLINFILNLIFIFWTSCKWFVWLTTLFSILIKSMLPLLFFTNSHLETITSWDNNFLQHILRIVIFISFRRENLSKRFKKSKLFLNFLRNWFRRCRSCFLTNFI